MKQIPGVPRSMERKYRELHRTGQFTEKVVGTVTEPTEEEVVVEKVKKPKPKKKEGFFSRGGA